MNCFSHTVNTTILLFYAVTLIYLADIVLIHGENLSMLGYLNSQIRFIFHVCVQLHVFMCTTYAQEPKRQTKASDFMKGELLVVVSHVGSGKQRSPSRAASGFNCWAISLASIILTEKINNLGS